MARSIFLILPLLVLTGCGPSDFEVARSVLYIAPVVTLLSALVAMLFARLWKPWAKDIQFSWRPALLVTAGQILALGVIAVAVDTPEEFDVANLFVVTIWLVGTSYLTLQLVFLRLAVTADMGKFYSWISVAPWLLLYPQTLFVGAGGSGGSLTEFSLYLWVYPGYAGLVTVPLFLLLLVEAGIRCRLQVRSSP